MWLESPSEINPQRPKRRYLAAFRCTAEHLVAKKDGGKTNNANIAAACHSCNKSRHARKHPVSADVYKRFVRRRIDKGRWHPNLAGTAPKGRPCRARHGRSH
ncbi:HNH endonuclease [Luteibacter sp. 621]|uniref:HNH endonuclease n=1 Tax=Luteibacter sp. 621 TaxID=3373916 RepID=UPI003D23EB29